MLFYYLSLKNISILIVGNFYRRRAFCLTFKQGGEGEFMKKKLYILTVIAVLFSFIVISSALAQGKSIIHFPISNALDPEGVEIGSGILQLRDGTVWIVAHAVNVPPECSCSLRICQLYPDPQNPSPPYIAVDNASTNGGTWHYHGIIEGGDIFSIDDVVVGKIGCFCLIPGPIIPVP